MLPTHISCSALNLAENKIDGVVHESRDTAERSLLGKEIVWNGYRLRVSKDVTRGEKRTLTGKYLGEADADFGTSTRLRVL